LTNIFPILNRTIDIVVSNFGNGSLDTFRVTGGTKRPDGGKGYEYWALFVLIRLNSDLIKTIL